MNERMKQKFELLCIFFFSVLFFSITCFFELLCVFLYAFVFPKIPIVKHFRMKAASEGSLTVSADLVAAGIQHKSDNAVSKFHICPWNMLKRQLDPEKNNINPRLTFLQIFIMYTNYFLPWKKIISSVGFVCLLRI